MNILRLKDVLAEKKMTGKELSEKIGVSEMTISNIVKGNNFPKPENLINIAQVLDVDIRDLFISTKEAKAETIYIKRGNDFLPIGEVLIQEWKRRSN
ncbi:helix-turn-helix transcriptional regulator [Chryseobacterium sp.]|uniref:helix-turn-helix domain-containing protein n=1 Tax=Chryseobacterium sp. TaxID=1871047 RepID=UPI002897EF0B|nr:helix-turn-helix transcriptional regulator [Chryseobacterium sp.]